MVGHHLKCIEHHCGVCLWQGVPDPLNDSSLLGQNHFVLNDFAKKEILVLCADGNETSASASVVISPQADGSPVVDEWVEGHDNDSFLALRT
jgi:hypothetical protein